MAWILCGSQRTGGHRQPSKSEFLEMKSKNSTQNKFPRKFSGPLAFENHLIHLFGVLRVRGYVPGLKDGVLQ